MSADLGYHKGESLSPFRLSDSEEKLRTALLVPKVCFPPGRPVFEPTILFPTNKCAYVHSSYTSAPVEVVYPDQMLEPGNSSFLSTGYFSKDQEIPL